MRQTNLFNALSAMNFLIKKNDKLNKNSGRTVLSDGDSALVSCGLNPNKRPRAIAVAPVHDVIIRPLPIGNDSQG
ncbi:hypothetical protein BGP78_08360 [Pseudoalteromonas sp. MSK9-3]|nr:hypothetical protein BGP78_08360 [Pseudoalteromonas sp. MSK9-3]